jgi:hypothetical protein
LTGTRFFLLADVEHLRQQVRYVDFRGERIVLVAKVGPYLSFQAASLASVEMPLEPLALDARKPTAHVAVKKIFGVEIDDAHSSDPM